MTPEEISRLAEAARRAGVRDLDLSGPGTSLHLRIEPEAGAAPPLSAGPRHPVAARAVRSPGVGVFYHRHPLTGQGSREAGHRVAAGQIVGFLDVGPCLRPVTAPEAGVLGDPLHDDGALVGYGTLLYWLT